MPALKAIYTAPTEQAAEQALDVFAASDLGRRYPAIVRTWQTAWSEFTPYLAFPALATSRIRESRVPQLLTARGHPEWSPGI